MMFDARVEVAGNKLGRAVGNSHMTACKQLCFCVFICVTRAESAEYYAHQSLLNTFQPQLIAQQPSASSTCKCSPQGL